MPLVITGVEESEKPATKLQREDDCERFLDQPVHTQQRYLCFVKFKKKKGEKKNGLCYVPLIREKKKRLAEASFCAPLCQRVKVGMINNTLSKNKRREKSETFE